MTTPALFSGSWSSNAVWRGSELARSTAGWRHGHHVGRARCAHPVGWRQGWRHGHHVGRARCAAFRKQSTTLRSAMWWKSVKTMLIMSCFVFVLVLSVAYGICGRKLCVF